MLSGFPSGLDTVKGKVLVNLSRPAKMVLCQEPRFFGGLKYFQKKERIAKWPLSSKRKENVHRIRDLERLDYRFTE